MPSAALHRTHLSPVNPKSTACRKPPMPVKKFTAPDLSAFSVHTCRGKAVSTGIPRTQALLRPLALFPEGPKVR